MVSPDEEATMNKAPFAISYVELYLKLSPYLEFGVIVLSVLCPPPICTPIATPNALTQDEICGI